MQSSYLDISRLWDYILTKLGVPNQATAFNRWAREWTQAKD